MFRCFLRQMRGPEEHKSPHKKDSINRALLSSTDGGACGLFWLLLPASVQRELGDGTRHT